MSYAHQPVLLDEVLEALQPQSGKNFIDCTLGGAGYSQALAEKVAPSGKVVALDLDPLAIKNVQEKKIPNLEIYQANFSEIEKVLEVSSLKKKKIAGLVADLGLSSAQLADSQRGFSYNSPGPLNMYFSGEGEEGAYEAVNSFSEKKLADLIYLYGEERRSRLIAKVIVNYRRVKKISQAQELAEIIEKAVPRRGHLHPATQTFQALRIFSNRELESLEKLLSSATGILPSGAIMAIVTFHSLEDRIVKQFLKNNSDWEKINKKVIKPSSEEIKNNFRARSAKLRIARHR